MKPSLQLRVSQSLTMTPQLQQAIKLLQLSSLDLESEIQEAVESNPMLELVDENQTQANDNDQESANTADGVSDHDLDFVKDNMPNDLPVDSQWEDTYHSSPQSLVGHGHGDDDRDFESFNSEADSLQDHLIWQLNLTPFSDTDKAIAVTIIESLNDEGYLSCSLDEILESVRIEDVTIEEVEAVLHRLQHFDPVGVCARDLQECLLIQLEQTHGTTPNKHNAEKIVSDHFQLLASRDFNQLKRKLKFSEENLSEAFKLIRSLNPRPGDAITPLNTQYIVPDLKVSKKRGQWIVELFQDFTPKLKINTDYASLVRRADSSADNQFLRNHLQEARWFLKSLQSRNETLLKVATEILSRQRGFLDYGEVAMKPLVLSDIADAVEMHESTISRVTTQKYIHTPRGIFELKYFFSSHVSTADGGECSATAIRALIKALVEEEDQRKPLSDNKIAQILKEQGINVARRTIAKYREAMRIPPSNERKNLP